ncbi:unnamed protein product, partial [Ranitomeya imitator]
MLSPIPEVRCLGVIFDSPLSFKPHIQALSTSCRLQLKNISRIRPFLNRQSTKMLVHALIISLHDYCSILFCGLPANTHAPLQVEDVFEDMKDVRGHVNFIKSLLHHLDDHIGHLQDLSGFTLDSIKTLTAQKAMESKRSHSMMSCDLSLSKQTTDDGLGQSTAWKKSKSSQILARSFSQSGIEKFTKTSNSLQRINGSDFAPVHNALFYLSDHLPEFQHGASDDNNIDYGKQKSLKSRSHVTIANFESKPNRVSEVINVSTTVQSKKSPLPKSPDSSSSALIDKTFKEEGFVNCAFTDDDGKVIYENNSGDEGPYSILSSELESATTEQPLPVASPNGDKCDTIVKKCKGQHSSNNKITGVFQKLWKQSKSPGIKAPAAKQDFSDIEVILVFITDIFFK